MQQMNSPNHTRIHKYVRVPLEQAATFMLQGQHSWNHYFHYQVQILYAAIFCLFATGWAIFELAVGNTLGALSFAGSLAAVAISYAVVHKLKAFRYWFHWIYPIVITSVSLGNYYSGGPTTGNYAAFLFLLIAAPCAMGISGFVWSLISASVAIVFAYMKYTGYIFPDYATESIKRTDELATLISSVMGIIISLLAYETTRTAVASRLQESERELRRSQLALNEANKMETIGRLAGGIAHDFNNLLTTIVGCAEILKFDLDKGHSAYQEAQDISAAGKQASKLTNQLLAISKKQMLQAEPINLNNTLEDILSMLKRVIGGNIRMEMDLDPSIRHAMLDEGQMEQVIMNLCLNAAEAMKGDGQITIVTRNDDRLLENGEASQTNKSAPTVLLEISDTGPGIAPEIVDNIFDPFFTTKPSGTGLGLSVVHGIIKQHKGTIEVSSTKDEGTTFQIFFPSVTAVGLQRTSLSGTHKYRWGDNNHILVVEDQSNLLNYTTRLLKRNGYRVTGVLSAEEALKALKENDDFALVFADVVLPKKSGLELASEIRKLKKSMPIVLTSGYSLENTPMTKVNELNAPFIAKPYKPEKLLALFTETLPSHDEPTD